MGALLDDLAVVEHGDLITELAGGQPVADINCSLIARDLVELCVDLGFSQWVQGGGSSSTMKGASLYRARAMAIFWASPPEMVTPSSSKSL